MAYPDFLERSLYHQECLETLKPTVSLPVARLLEIRAATVEDLTGSSNLASRAALIRALLFWANDSLDEAHKVVADNPSDLAAYLHGLVHRREEDFENARYWFRRAGELPFFGELQRQGSAHSEEVARQVTWDPYLFVGLCERHKYGSRTSLKMLAALQQTEFTVFLNYLFRSG